MRLPLVHLNLTVADVERSLRFYRRTFGFASAPRLYPDGTVFVGNDDGFDLAFHPGARPAPPVPAVHFVFRAADADAVRVRGASRFLTTRGGRREPPRAAGASTACP